MALTSGEKMMQRIILLVLATLWSLLIYTLNSFIYSQEKQRIAVYNINLGNTNFDNIPAEEFANRIVSVGNQIIERTSSGMSSWDLIGLNECFARKVNKHGFFWCDRYYSEKNVPCQPTNTESLTAPCLASYLTFTSGNNINNYSFQLGEVGIVAMGELMVPIESKAWRIGNRPLPCKLRRQLVGTRFRINTTGHILPFFSTHIGPDDMKKKQLEDLVSDIKDWWKPGDLTPVVVGDFNMYKSWDEYNLMSQNFDEVGALFGKDRTEQIWIGKENSFPGSSGKMKAVRYEIFDSSTPTHSFDHPATYAELETPVGQDVNLSNGEILSNEEKTYYALKTIAVSNYSVKSEGKLTLIAGDKISLKSNFHVESGGFFNAKIE